MRKEIAGFKFITEKGFASELPGLAVERVQMKKEEPVKETPKAKKEQIDIVFDFAQRKNRKNPRLESNVIHVNFNKQEEKEEKLSLPEKIVEGILAAGEKALRPIKEYFFGSDDDDMDDSDLKGGCK